MRIQYAMLSILLVVSLLAAPTRSEGSEAKEPATVKPTSIHQFEMEDINGTPVKLSQFEGSVLLVVNVASKCGLTPQYKELQATYSKYKDQDFAILGFPANNFASQEPGTDAEIKEFCRLNYGVSFPMFSKISVKGEDKHPLYKYLTEQTDPAFRGEIPWNFNKFLVNGKGEVIGRFEPKVTPDSAEVTSAIEKAIGEKADS